MSSTIRASTADVPDGVAERSDRTRAVGALVVVYAVAGLGLAIAATVLFPLDARLAVPFSLGGLDSRLLGLALWVGVCLVTSSRGSREDGRVAATLGLGPVVAVAALGGPAAATWVAMLGSTEARELRGDVPWYGTLANHGMATFSWTVCGLVMWALRQIAGSESVKLMDLAIVMAAWAIGLAINAAMAGLMVSIRTGRSFAACLGIGGRAVAVTYAADACLAWLIAQAYVLVAWWTPALFVVASGAAGGSLGRHRAAWQLRHHQITELPNGIALSEHANDLRGASPSGICVFYIDLDGFKAVNDDHGHLVGDDVLRVVGVRLAGTADAGSFVAHLHGDEFVVLARGVADDDEAEAIASRLVAVIEPPIPHRVGDLRVSATAGFSFVTDLNQLDAGLRDADRRMSDAKADKARATGRDRRRS